VVHGNAAQSETLSTANPAAARCPMTAIPKAFEAGQIVEQAHAANPDIQIIARAHSDVEVRHLKSIGADTAIMGEREIAREIIEDLTARRAVNITSLNKDRDIRVRSTGIRGFHSEHICAHRVRCANPGGRSRSQP